MSEKFTLAGKRVLVTGGSGVIGRELLRRLIDIGSEIMTIDRVPLSDEDWGDVIEVRKDIADEDLSELVDFDPEVIFHLAAGFERSKESPEFWSINWHDNVCVNNRILSLITPECSAEVYVFASSYLAYTPELYFFNDAQDTARPLKEDDPKQPRNLCGAAKFYAESEMDFIQDNIKSSLRMVAARIYRVYGCGSNDVVSRWVRSALKGEAIDLYNKDNLFDYIYAGDVADGLIKMAETRSASGAINLGTGNARKVEDLLLAINEKVAGGNLDIHDQGGVEEFEASCADVDQLYAVTGWKPTTTLEQGIDIIMNCETDN